MNNSNNSDDNPRAQLDGRASRHAPVESRRAIIIGASSGIGRALALELAHAGYVLGVAARRRNSLVELLRRIPTACMVAQIDMADTAEAMRRLQTLIDDMDGIDLFVYAAGVGHLNPALEWQPEADTIAVNVTGFVAAMNVAASHFERRGRGHLLAVSSVAALRGSGEAPAYNASKAFVSNYLAGLRRRFRTRGLPIPVTDVRAGFVATAMAKGDRLFWMATPERAAAQICKAIGNRRSVIYVTRRWHPIAWLLKLLPERMSPRC